MGALMERLWPFGSRKTPDIFSTSPSVASSSMRLFLSCCKTYMQTSFLLNGERCCKNLTAVSRGDIWSIPSYSTHLSSLPCLKNVMRPSVRELHFSLFPQLHEVFESGAPALLHALYSSHGIEIDFL
jgi:hypothetical protein